MLHFSAKLLVGDKELVEVTGICPYCGYHMSFYYYAPEYCNDCGRKLPDFGSILECTKERLEYHRFGTTIKRFGAFKNFVERVKDEFHRSKT